MEQGGAVKADSQAESGSQAVARASRGTHRGTYGRIEAHRGMHIEGQLLGEAVARTEVQPLFPFLHPLIYASATTALLLQYVQAL